MQMLDSNISAFASGLGSSRRELVKVAMSNACDHVRSALTANGYTIPVLGSLIDNSLYDE